LIDEIEVTRRTFEAPQPDTWSEQRARLRLRAVIEAERSAFVPASTPPTRRRTRWLGVAAATILAVVTSAILLRGGGSPDTATLLRSLASSAASSEGTRVPVGQNYLYLSGTETQIVSKDAGTGSVVNVATGASVSFSVSSLVEIKVYADGSADSTQTIESVAFASPQDEQLWNSLDDKPAQPKVGSVTPQHFLPGELTATDDDSIPVDPTAALSALRKPQEGEGALDDEQVMGRIAGLLTYGELRSDQRAALFQVLADLQGIRSLGKVVDPDGRTGQAFLLPQGSTSKELIFDPATSDVLATIDTGDSGAREHTTVFEPPQVRGPQPTT
jgi:hypothetical protein